MSALTSVCRLAPLRGDGTEKAGFTVSIVDERTTTNPAQSIRKALKQSLFVGISSMTGYQINHGLLAQQVRSESGYSHRLGRRHPTIHRNQRFDISWSIFVTVGEGKKQRLSLPRHLRKGGLVQCAAFLKDGSARAYTGEA
jgi:hypothetical protein